MTEVLQAVITLKLWYLLLPFAAWYGLKTFLRLSFRFLVWWFGSRERSFYTLLCSMIGGVIFCALEPGFSSPSKKTDGWLKVRELQVKDKQIFVKVED